uniref:Uncharacterized protein n=1 Tax=Moniliophthora roreri TaxID=221103 RepID=A0A0W0G259_MONRR
MAKMYWPVLNAIRAACCQMNLGSQEEHINLSHGDWNWRKTVGMTQQLYKNLEEQKAVYIDKCNHFAAFCLLFADKVIE